MREIISRYYFSSGAKREEIKQEIIDAIHLNPNQDPSRTVAQKREGPVDTYGHLDIVLPLTEMARDGEISYNPKSGWSTELPPSAELFPEG